MALISKPDYTYIWSSGGSKISPTNTKIQTGWTAEVPPFQYENWIQNRQDQAIAHIFQRGISQWDGLTNYEANVCYVTGSDGQVYKSVAASGPSTTIQDPVTDTSDTYWKTAFAEPGAFLTQTTGDARYTQRANNLSDLSSAPAARVNLGVDFAVKAGIAGTFSNLEVSATGLSALITITANALCLKNSANEQVVVNAISVTPSLAASGVNGLDTGTSVSNTWYSLWVIWNGSNVAGLLSASATSPTMPSGYTHKARIGWVRSDSTANKYPLSFIQRGRRVRYKLTSGSNVTALPTLSSGTQGTAPSTWATIATANFVPPTAAFISVLATATLQNTNNIAVAPSTSYVSTSGATNSAPLAIYQSTANAGGASAAGDIMLESNNIYVIANQFSGASLVLCAGWEDNL